MKFNCPFKEWEKDFRSYLGEDFNRPLRGQNWESTD